jgi:hypothetical protein
VVSDSTLQLSPSKTHPVRVLERAQMLWRSVSRSVDRGDVAHETSPQLLIEFTRPRGLPSD